MFKKLIVVMVCLIVACFLRIGLTVDAQAQCSSPTTLSLSSGSNRASSTTSTTKCYQVTQVSSSAASFTLDVSVTSGSVNIYWASGSVQTLSRRLNAQKNLNTTRRFVPTKSNTSTYSLAIVPTAQSTFTFTIKAVTPRTSSVSTCPRADGYDPCAAVEATQEPQCVEGNGAECSSTQSVDAIVEDYAGASVSFPFDAACRSRLEAYVSWLGTASQLELRLEDERPFITGVQGASPLHVVYDSQPQDFADGNQWQWTLVNVSGGSVEQLDIHLSHPDDVACASDPAAIYGVNACIYGYVWREAFPGDVVCVTGDVRQQAWDDNAQAASRIDPASPYGPSGCIAGYVWREASPSDLVCVTGDVRQQAWDDNAQAAARRDTLDTPVPPDTSDTSAPASPPDGSTTCPNSLPPRMVVGESGRVTPGDPNTLRTQPTTAARRVGLIPGGESFIVLEGPACADNLTWWKVQYSGLEGWTAEGGSGVYWIEPTG